MSTIDKLNELKENGTLSELIDKGLVSKHVESWRKIYLAYKDELIKNDSKLQAMENVAYDFKISVDLIRHIRRKLD
jgi:hypothetical protein